ncbi:hypothetical protein, partial [Amycolatopsis japonica]
VPLPSAITVMMRHNNGAGLSPPQWLTAPRGAPRGTCKTHTVAMSLASVISLPIVLVLGFVV